MKKFIALFLALLMTASMCVLVGCNSEQEGLEKAKLSLIQMYLNAETVTAKDFVRVGIISADGVDYKVTWTANVEESKVKIIPSADGKSVTVDIDEHAAEDYLYTLTATISNSKGTSVTQLFTYRVPKGEPLVDEELVRLEKVKAALADMYKNESATTSQDFVRVGVITVDGVDYKIAWTTNADEAKVKIIPSSNGGMVTVDIDEHAEEAYSYALTATIYGQNSKTVSQTYNYQVPKGEPIVDEELVGLQNAQRALETMYPVAETEITDDYTRVSQIVTDEVYTVTWTVDVEETKVKIVPSSDGQSVTVDINEHLSKAYEYVLTATISNSNGRKIVSRYNCHVPVGKPFAYDAAACVITGQFAGWSNAVGEDGPKKEFEMTPMFADDERIASIYDKLIGVKYLYIAEHTFTNNKDPKYRIPQIENGEEVKDENGNTVYDNPDGWEAGWSVKYALTAGGDLVEVDGNMAIKVIKAQKESVAGQTVWMIDWRPDAGNTTVKSLTPDTFYCPPHSENPTYENSGTWYESPIVLEAGTYYVVFAEYENGTFGIGAIAK